MKSKNKVAFIIDSIETLNPKKDSSIMMLQESYKKGWDTYYLTLNDLYVENGQAFGISNKVEVSRKKYWYKTLETKTLNLSDFDVILMRKDPPFNMEYIYATYILELAEKSGTLIVNKPQMLRDANEKFYISYFPEYAPKTLITRKSEHIKSFLKLHKDIILKPLDGMGGASIFRVKEGNKNLNVIIETLTNHNNLYAMVQKYQPEIKDGDKRIIIINGKPLENILVRIPSDDDNRGNMAAGATTLVRKLNDIEREIAIKIGEHLKSKGVIFAGLDIIGTKLTEVNITSPTGIRQIFSNSKENGAKILINEIEKLIK